MGRRRRKRRPRRRRSRRKRYVYLGKRVRDTGRRGLDRPKEFIGIAKAIARDYKAGRISKRKALGRYMLLMRLTSPKHNRKVRSWSPKTRARVRAEIRRIERRALSHG